MTVTEDYAPAMAESEMINRAEAARRLGVALSTLDGYARKGDLTRLRTGRRRVYFRADEVEALRQHLEDVQAEGGK